MLPLLPQLVLLILDLLLLAVSSRRSAKKRKKKAPRRQPGDPHEVPTPRESRHNSRSGNSPISPCSLVGVSGGESNPTSPSSVLSNHIVPRTHSCALAARPRSTTASSARSTSTYGVLASEPVQLLSSSAGRPPSGNPRSVEEVRTPAEPKRGKNDAAGSCGWSGRDGRSPRWCIAAAREGRAGW